MKDASAEQIVAFLMGGSKVSRALLRIDGPVTRARAARLLDKVALGTRVEFKGGRRTLPQNDKMWAMLTDVSRQQTWPPGPHGIKLIPDDWKKLFLDALKREVRTVPNLDLTGFVNLGNSSSDLSKDEMSQLIELIAAWGAQNGVVFLDEAWEHPA
jgi:NinB protein